MNSLMALAGFIAALYACIYAFTTLEVNALGYIALAVVFLMLLLLFFGAMEDINSGREYFHKEDEE